MEFLRRL